MPQLIDVDGKTVPVISRKMRNPTRDLWNWDRYQEIGIKEGMSVWVTMTTKGKLFDANIPLFDLQQTADGWEYLVDKAMLIKYLRTLTPPFKLD